MKPVKGTHNFIFCTACGGKIRFYKVPEKSFIRSERKCQSCK